MLLRWDEKNKKLTLVFASGASEDYKKDVLKHYKEMFPEYTVEIGSQRVDI